MNTFFLTRLLLLCCLALCVTAFVQRPCATLATTRSSPSLPQQNSLTVVSLAPSTLNTAAVTLDPATFFTDLLSGVIGSNAILAVPILAALGVAGLLVAFIIGYANPQVEDDE